MAAFREALAVLSERIAADTEAVAEWSARMAALALTVAVFATLITADAEAVIDCPERIAALRLAVAVLPTAAPDQNSGIGSGANTCHGFSVSDLCSEADSMRSKTRTR